VRIGYREPSP
jgi:hypothetical protein